MPLLHEDPELNIASRSTNRPESCEDGTLVVHVCSSYPPSPGGMELRVRELVQRLRASGCPVRVITSATRRRVQSDPSEDCYVHRLWHVRLANTNIMPSLPLALLRIPRDSIIHVHFNQSYIPEVALICSLIRRCSLIVHVRGEVRAYGRLGFLLDPYKDHIMSRVLGRASAVIVLTDGYRSLISTRFKVPLDNINVVPNASDFPRVPLPQEMSGNQIHLLSVGRLSPEKNIGTLLQATRILSDTGYDVRVRLAGDGREKSSLEALCAMLGIAQRVEFIGWVGGSSLIREYDRCHIVVQSSFDEGFSTVLIEAMARGKPVIATNILGTRDIVQDGANGLLVEPGNEQALADAIRRLARNKVLYTAISKSGLESSEKYSWTAIVESILHVYRSILK